MPIIKKSNTSDSNIYSNEWKSYNDIEIEVMSIKLFKTTTVLWIGQQVLVQTELKDGGT